MDENTVMEQRLDLDHFTVLVVGSARHVFGAAHISRVPGLWSVIRGSRQPLTLT